MFFRDNLRCFLFFVKLFFHRIRVNHVNVYGFTPLMIAAYHGRDKAVELLIEWGADIDMSNPCDKILHSQRHMTAIDYAYSMSNFSTALIIGNTPRSLQSWTRRGLLCQRDLEVNLE